MAQNISIIVASIGILRAKMANGVYQAIAQHTTKRNRQKPTSKDIVKVL